MSSKSRRTTLGVLNNRRASMMTTASSGLPSGTSSSSSNSSKPKIKSRMSMAPRISSSSNNNNNHSDQGRAATPNARRKSYGGAENRRKIIMPSVPSSSLSNNHNSNNINLTTTSNAIKTETRPISDKKYINSCIRKLHNYLITHNYENPVKLKDLTRPSAKDFHNFVTFLLQKVDPSFPYDDSSTGSSSSNSTRKIEDDIALAFKALGYPFSISKTALVAAGSPHTWPTLLLALTWLIELLDCTEEEDFNFYHRRRPRRAVRKEIQIDQNGEEVEVDVEEEEDDYDDDDDDDDDTITFEMGALW